MKVTSSDLSLDKVAAEAVAIPVLESSSKDRVEQLASFKKLPEFKLEDFSGKLYETFQIPATESTPLILLVGVGKKEDFDSRIARNVAGTAVRRALKSKVKTLVYDASLYENSALIIEGVGLGEFDPGIYKTGKDKAGKLEELIIVGKIGVREIKEALDVVETVNWARRLINEPANLLTPTHIVNEAKKIARDYKLDIEVINEKDAVRRGMGAFAGIARGSHEPSFLVALKYSAGKNYPTLGVVGKGITFDSGGLSIKPSEKMHEMKMDMAGAAAVIGLLKLVAILKPKVNVVGVTPLTENLPGGGALKPGDVVRALNGKTIEVLNTDAEGRLILADALSYAVKYQPKEVIDFATLTGACLVALGNDRSGLFGTEEKIIEKLKISSSEVGEQLWQLPLGEEYSEAMKSEVADIKNLGGAGAPGFGGASTAAAFLQFFTDYPWAHIDLSCSYYDGKGKIWIRGGANGFGVQTMIEYLR